MKWQTLYTKQAYKDLSKLDTKIAQIIYDKIEFFAKQENPLLLAKRLTDSQLGQYRFRIGDYRAIFDVDTNGQIKILLILTVKHRKDVYKNQ